MPDSPIPDDPTITWNLHRVFANKDSIIGTLVAPGGPLWWTLELPWRNNLQSVSCIPAGKYPLSSRVTTRFGYHLALGNVPNRSGILIHAANNASEIQGCIAPGSSVYKWTGTGWGVSGSKAALGDLCKRFREIADDTRLVQFVRVHGEPIYTEN